MHFEGPSESDWIPCNANFLRVVSILRWAKHYADSISLFKLVEMLSVLARYQGKMLPGNTQHFHHRYVVMSSQQRVSFKFYHILHRFSVPDP